MKRRHALITSATVSVVVLGGAVTAAAWSGNGLLGFRHSDPSGATSAASDGASVEADTATVTSPAPQAPGTTVQVRVVEDRIVVRSGGTATGGESVLGRLSAADAGAVDVPSDPESSTTAPPASTTSTTVRARPHDDDDDDDDEYDEYEHEDHDDEHEHGEYEDD